MAAGGTRSGAPAPVGPVSAGEPRASALRSGRRAAREHPARYFAAARWPPGRLRSRWTLAGRDLSAHRLRNPGKSDVTVI